MKPSTPSPAWEQKQQCESVSKQGLRCGLDAGHSGDHNALGRWHTDPRMREVGAAQTHTPQSSGWEHVDAEIVRIVFSPGHQRVLCEAIAAARAADASQIQELTKAVQGNALALVMANQSSAHQIAELKETVLTIQRIALPEGVGDLIDAVAELRDEAGKVAALSAQVSGLRDWQATVTAALGREGGAFYEDVPKHVRELRAQVAQLTQEKDKAESHLQAIARHLCESKYRDVALKGPSFFAQAVEWLRADNDALRQSRAEQGEGQ